MELILLAFGTEIIASRIVVRFMILILYAIVKLNVYGMKARNARLTFALTMQVRVHA